MATDFTASFKKTLAGLGIDLSDVGRGLMPGVGLSPYSTVYSGEDVNAERQAVLDPKVQALAGQLASMRAQEAARGGPATAPHPGMLGRILGFLGRPGAAVMSGLVRGGRELAPQIMSGTATLGDVAHGYAEAGKGALAGLTGKEYHDASEILAMAGVKSPVVRALGGFAMDVAADPLSYLGVGVAKHAVVDVGKIDRAVAAATQVAGRSGGAVDAQALTRALATDIPGQKAVLTPRQVAARTNVGVGVIDRTARAVGQAAESRATANMVDQLITSGMGRVDAQDAAARWVAALRVGGKPLAQAAMHDTTESLTELLTANLDQQIRRTIKAGFGGAKVPIAPIPQFAMDTLGRAAKVDLIAKTVNAFDKTFHTGTRFDNTLTVAKARAIGMGERRIDQGRSDVIDIFSGTNSQQRQSYMHALTSSPDSFGAGVLAIGGNDLAGPVQAMLDDIGRYIDFNKDGSALLTADDLNRYLPKPLKFEKTTVPGGLGGPGQLNLLNPAAGTPAHNMALLLAANAGHLKGVDPAHYLYALRIATEQAVARDQLGRAIGVLGVPVAPSGADTAAHELVTKHGYEPLYTKGQQKDVSAFYRRHFDGLIFSPEVKAGVKRIIGIADHLENRSAIGRGYDRALGGLKKALTLPSPSYHIRNSFGDFIVSLLDGVFGPRGMASYDQAARTMASLRKVGKRPDVAAAMTAGVDPATGIAANPVEMLAGATPGTWGARVMKVPRAWSDVHGNYLSAEQVWAAYNHAGLNQGFTHADLPHIFSISNRSGVPGAASKTVNTMMALSQGRENYFRLAHFIDRLKRSTKPTLAQAAEEAAYYVRKFHFDYTDVTPTERAVFARAIPFYKWQRFAVPLMLQTFFAKPGAILNTQRALAAMSAMQGFGTDPQTMLPRAEAILPSYFRDAMMLPLYQHGNNLVYFNPGLPPTQILAQTLGLSAENPSAAAGKALQNAVSMVNPMALTPIELATGHKVFGGGQIPTGSLAQYFAGQTPISNLAFNRIGSPTGNAALYSFLTGLGLQENTPSKQTGAILDEEAKIRENRKKAGFTPFPPVSGRGGRGGRPRRAGR